MNKYKDIMNPYEIPKVILAPVSDDIQLDENLEPPFIRVRETNSQYLLINSNPNKNIPAQNPSDIILTLDRGMPRVNRLAFRSIQFINLSPNINPRNNIFNFFRNGVAFTATITPNQNFNGLLRYQALVAEMNIATGTPGEFTATLSPTLVNTITITNTLANTFRFSNNSNGVMKGQYLFGFNISNFGLGTDATSHVLSYITDNYTRYFDITSFELTQYTKIDSSGVNVPAEALFRVFLIDNGTTDYGNNIIVSPSTLPPFLNYERSRSISTVDIKLLDEFNEVLYIPVQYWYVFTMFISIRTDM